MNKPLKIAIYSGAVPSTTFIERLIQGLAKNGNTIFLFGVQKAKQSAVKNVYYYTYTNKLSKLFQLIKYSILLRLFKSKDKKKLDAFILNKSKNTRLFKVKFYPILHHKPDIFHLQWAKSLDDWIWVQEFDIKLVLSLRGTHITISPTANEELVNMYSKYFPQVDGFHAVSNTISKIAQHYGAQTDKIKTVYSGLPLEEIQLKPKSEGIKTLKILSVGRSHWTKGYSVALDAMSLLKQTNFKFHYTITGIDNDEALLFQRHQLDLEQQVTFLETLPFEDVVKLQHSSDVLFLPSIEEGIANVVLEAMALGTLVVSTHCGGMREVIEDGLNGFLVPIRNPEAMANALMKVSTLSMEDYLNVIQSGRKTIEQQHSVEKMIADMQSLYGHVLNNGKL